jgi:uncharacterized circularly permuted ATP-grasp superfamily protein
MRRSRTGMWRWHRVAALQASQRTTPVRGGALELRRTSAAANQHSWRAYCLGFGKIAARSTLSGVRPVNDRPIFNEMYAAAGEVRPHYLPFDAWLANQSEDLMRLKRTEADQVFRRVGITFAVYGDGAGTERLIPFDVIPRIIPEPEWRLLEQGLRQRVQALNLFLHDVYHEQRFLRSGRMPVEQVLGNSQYRPQMHGVDVASGIYAHIAGIDIVRAGAGEYYVLEDNLRVPSGVSYMLENRRMMMRLFPELFARNRVAPVEHYPDLLLENLRSVAPQGVDDPTVVLLTPGMYNSAYFEHAFLAQQMGVELVEGQDLFVQDNAV